MKLSIIIPAYNAYNFLQDLVPHIAEQLTKESEIIIIDDGSTDELKFNTMPIVHHIKENLGVAAARNVGVQLAKGEYVAFVDADDWVSDDFVKTILDTIKKYKSRHDIYWFKTKTEDGYSTFHIVPVWGKALRKDIFEDVMFDEQFKAGEDIAFQQALENSDYTCKSVEKEIYHYRWSANPDSLSKKHNRGEFL